MGQLVGAHLTAPNSSNSAGNSNRSRRHNRRPPALRSGERWLGSLVGADGAERVADCHAKYGPGLRVSALLIAMGQLLMVVWMMMV